MKTRMLLGLTALAMVVVVASLSGCYTVLKHPTQVSMTDDQGGRRSCADCHEQSSFYHDPYMYRYYDRYSYSDRWYGYYYDPWWYDDYWYYDSWDGEGPALQTGGRTRWGNEPQRATPPDRGATTAVGTTGSPTSAAQPKVDDPGSSGSSSDSVDKNKRTRWGNEPARATPPTKSSEPKKSGDDKDPKKQADNPKK